MYLISIYCMVIEANQLLFSGSTQSDTVSSTYLPK